MSNAQFDASLPSPYKENWREAYRDDPAESPRMASYQAPGGEAIPFIQKGFRFSGGHSKDTAEYPFGGLWSNEHLNEKPQSLTVDGYLRGPAYIAQRNKLIEALRIPTDDDNPGFIDLPFWGRFPIVVNDNYEISENADEQGQCLVSISFTRAGVSITDRMNAQTPASEELKNAVADLEAAAVDDFDAKLKKRLDIRALMAAFGKIKSLLLSVLGRIQGAMNFLNQMTNEVLGIMNLINRGIRSPREFAQALFNAGMSIAGGVLAIKNSAGLYSKDSLSNYFKNNERNVLLLFLSANTNTLSGEETVSASHGAAATDEETATAGQEGAATGSGNQTLQREDVSSVNQKATVTASENLYRTMAFAVSALLIANTDSITYKKAAGYWQLLEKLEESIDRETPAVYAAMQAVHNALSRALSEREISREMTRRIPAAAPLLYLAYYLGCDEDKIRELNSVADSFAVEGDVIYV
jgi:prophage DNA circulation protein